MSIKMAMPKGEVGLDSYGNRGSFYGKCGVRLVGKIKVLRSYNVDYAAFYRGHIVRLYDGAHADGVTTMAHFAAFCKFCGVPYHGKNGNGKGDIYAWRNIPYAQLPYGANDEELAEVVTMAVSRIWKAA